MCDLAYETKNGWLSADETTKKEIFDLCDDYKNYLNEGRTERLACAEAVRRAKEAGFCDLASKDSLKPGDKVYMVNRDKSVYLAVIGEEDILEGISFVIAHIDSPRMDLKQNPLYEDSDMTLLKLIITAELKNISGRQLRLHLQAWYIQKKAIRLTSESATEQETLFFA